MRIIRTFFLGFYDLFSDLYKPEHTQFSFYAASRLIPDEGRQRLSSLMLRVKECKTAVCRKKKTEFVSAVQYHQLRKENDYKKLGRYISRHMG